MTTPIRVAVMMGGRSFEHDVSLASGAGVMKHLLPDRYLGFPVVITREGLWKIDGTDEVPMTDGLSVLARRADVVFLALHGPNGEDGSMQGLFTLAGIPYTGSDLFASSLAMNKPRTKDVYRGGGLTTPLSAEIREGDSPGHRARVAAEFVGQVGLPLVVKTTRLGSSVGVGIAKTREHLDKLVGENLVYCGHVLLEQFITGRELTAAVLWDPYQERLLRLPLIEIRPKISAWFDFQAKYQVGGSEEICPAPISLELTERVQEIGARAHQMLGCAGMSRTDVIVGHDEQCYVIETNTIPGFTQTSLLPQAAAKAGLTYETMVDYLLQEALKRTLHQES